MDSARPWRGGRWRTQKWRDYVRRLRAYRVQIVAVTVIEAEARAREKVIGAELKPALDFNPTYGGRASA